MLKREAAKHKRLLERSLNRTDLQQQFDCLHDRVKMLRDQGYSRNQIAKQWDQRVTRSGHNPITDGLTLAQHDLDRVLEVVFSDDQCHRVTVIIDKIDVTIYQGSYVDCVDMIHSRRGRSIKLNYGDEVITLASPKFKLWDCDRQLAIPHKGKMKKQIERRNYYE
jgi:hypothetical protein